MLSALRQPLRKPLRKPLRRSSPAEYFLGPDARQGAYIDPTLPNVMFQDFAMLPASALGDAIRITLDANSLGKTKVGFLDGTSGCYFSTPDAAALDITGDTTIEWGGRLTSLANGALQTLGGKFLSTGSQRSYLLWVTETGQLNLISSETGATSLSNATTAVISSVVDPGQYFEVRASYDVNKAGDREVVYEISTAPLGSAPAWSLFETVATPGGATSIFAGTAVLTIGATQNGTLNLMAGTVSHFRLYSGIGGSASLVLDADFAAYSGSGNTFTATTGQTVTRNGTSYITGDGYHDVAPSDATRRQRARMPLGGRRNLALYTEDVTNAAWTAVAMTITGSPGICTQNAIPTAASSQHALEQSMTFPAGTVTMYFYAETGGYDFVQLDWGFDTNYANFQISTATVKQTSAGWASAASVSAVPGFPGRVRCVVTIALGAGGTQPVRIVPLPLGTEGRRPTFTGDGVSGVKASGLQCEMASAPTGYQKVTAAYDITESGVPDVIWEYGAGTQYSVIQGSRNLTFLHDGAGGDAFLNAYVNKVDDGAIDVFAGSSSPTTGGRGFFTTINDNSGNAPLQVYIGNDTVGIFNSTSADEVIPRFLPALVSYSYAESSAPEVAGYVDGVSQVSGATIGAPSASPAANDVHIGASPSGDNILPGYIGTRLLIASMTAAQRASINAFCMSQTG